MLLRGTSVFIGLLLAQSLSAQTTGDIRGIVSDPSGAAAANAKVALTSNETGESRKATTDGEGRYAFRLLKIGEYTVAVEAGGFRKAVATAPVKSAEITSVNIVLEVGQVTEQVTVTDAASPLDTQSAQVQESFAAKNVAEMPVARNPNNIALSLPGITPPPGGMNSGSFISNGNRARANNITIDNITATDISVAGTGSSNNQPLNFSSIKEVKIITNNFSAEFGRNSGSQVQYITKSGTNQIHGEAYEYVQNNVFNARDWFDQSGKPTVTRVNQYGGVLGGPIIRNKTHFFVATEQNPTRGAGSARIAQVPTAAMLAQVTDPTSKKLLDFYKLPAATSEAASFGTVQQNAALSVIAYQYSVRIDHQLTSKDTIYGRFGKSYNEGTSSNNTFIATNLANFGLKSTNTPYSANINETHIFSGALINEFRAGFGRTFPYFNIDSTVTPAGPRITFINAQVASFGHYNGGPQGRVQNTFQYGDTLSWTRGAHNVKAGGDFFRYQGNSSFENDTRGRYQFLNWDDFAAGRPNQYTQAFGGTIRGARTWQSGLFIQDDYRLTPALTLNLGFRTEIYGPVSEVNKILSNLDFNCKTPMGAAGAGPLGCFAIGQNAIAMNVYPQPRVGIAWNPKGGKTVFRAGYGLVADFNFLNPVTNQRFLPPFVVTQNIVGAPNFTGGNTFANLIAGAAPIQAEGLSQVGKVATNILNFGDVNPVIDPNLKNPQVHQWSFGIQRQLPDSTVLKVSYVGTKGNFLQRARQVNLNANPPRPAASLAEETARTQEFLTSFNALTGSAARFSGRADGRFNVVNYNDNSANSNYHALEVYLVRPFRGGYSVHVAGTFSKSIDDVSDALTTIPNDSTLIQDPRNSRSNRSVSGFDLPYRIAVTHGWELPWGKKLGNPVLKHVLSGWGMSGISSRRAGYPVSFTAGPRLGLANISAITTGLLIRPNANGAFDFNPIPSGAPGAPNGLNTDPVAGRRISAYAERLGLSQPLLGNFGALGRNTHRLNGQTNFDWNVYKTIPIGERVNVKLRCEMYNMFNNHSFRDVVPNISNPVFGQYQTPDQGQRVVQLAGVVSF